MKKQKQGRFRNETSPSISSTNKSSKDIAEFCQSTQNYLRQMQKLFAKFQISKIRRLTKEVKNSNPSFKDYIVSNHITLLKFEDLLKFQEDYIEDRRKLFSFSYEKVREGFMELKKKLQDYEVVEFETQVKYFTCTIERELLKLEHFGGEYEGIAEINTDTFEPAQIFEDEKQNGPYKLFRKSEIQKSLILEEADKKIKDFLFQR